MTCRSFDQPRDEARESGDILLSNFASGIPTSLSIGSPVKARSRVIQPVAAPMAERCLLRHHRSQALEARLLALNETLEARVAEVGKKREHLKS